MRFPPCFPPPALPPRTPPIVPVCQFLSIFHGLCISALLLQYWMKGFSVRKGMAAVFDHHIGLADSGGVWYWYPPTSPYLSWLQTWIRWQVSELALLWLLCECSVLRPWLKRFSVLLRIIEDYSALFSGASTAWQAIHKVPRTWGNLDFPLGLQSLLCLCCERENNNVWTSL